MIRRLLQPLINQGLTRKRSLTCGGPSSRGWEKSWKFDKRGGGGVHKSGGFGNPHSKMSYNFALCLPTLHSCWHTERTRFIDKKVSHSFSTRLFWKFSQVLLVLKLSLDFSDLRALFVVLILRREITYKTENNVLLHKNDFNNLNLSHITSRFTKRVKIVWFNLKILKNFLNFFELALELS